MLLAGGAAMVYHLMSDEDVTRIMRHPQVAFASDSGVLGVRRRRAASARLREQRARARRSTCGHDHVIMLEEAIRKMTSLPAEHFRFQNRGAIKVGYAADVVVFDASRVEDTATYERPHAYPTGIAYVLVNGVPVVDGGDADERATRAGPGEVADRAEIEGSFAVGPRA